MDIKELISQTRSIVKDHFAGMENLEMGDSDIDVLRKDLKEQLQTEHPEIDDVTMRQLYDELDKQGHIKLLTNDIVTFKKEFAR